MADNEMAELTARFMAQAAAEAAGCKAEGDATGGAVLAHDATIVATGRTRRHETGDPIRYAVMDCISNAGRRTDQAELTLYVSGPMTWLDAGTVVQFSIGTVVVPTSTAPDRVRFLREHGVTVHVADGLR